MNREILKQVIRDQHEVIQNEVIIQRDIHLEKNANYIIVGLRRSGQAAHAASERRLRRVSSESVSDSSDTRFPVLRTGGFTAP